MIGNCLRSVVPGKPLGEKYDLKGHLDGRKVTDVERKSNRNITLKDGDFDMEVVLNGASYSAVHEAIIRDTEYCTSCGMMDYSLLVGVQSTECNASGQPAWCGGAVVVSADGAHRFYL